MLIYELKKINFLYYRFALVKFIVVRFGQSFFWGGGGIGCDSILTNCIKIYFKFDGLYKVSDSPSTVIHLFCKHCSTCKEYLYLAKQCKQQRIKYL